MANGHELAREILVKHGIDRYTTVPASMLKVVEEVGELAAELLKSSDSEQVRKEYGDAGISLYLLGDKLGLDLGECMRAVVAGETRRFI